MSKHHYEVTDIITGWLNFITKAVVYYSNSKKKEYSIKILLKCHSYWILQNLVY